MLLDVIGLHEASMGLVWIEYSATSRILHLADQKEKKSQQQLPGGMLHGISRMRHVDS